jgi:hypothetical protein
MKTRVDYERLSPVTPRYWVKLDGLRDNRGEAALTFRSEPRGLAEYTDAKFSATKSLGFPLCTRKQKRLITGSQNLAKLYAIEFKRVNSSVVNGWQKNAGGKKEGNVHYVIENKCRKYVRNQAFHYVNENKQDRVAFPLCL